MHLHSLKSDAQRKKERNVFSTLLMRKERKRDIRAGRNSAFFFSLPIRPRFINADRNTRREEKPCVNWPLPEWDTAIAPRPRDERVTANLYLRSTWCCLRAYTSGSAYKGVSAGSEIQTITDWFINRRIDLTCRCFAPVNVSLFIIISCTKRGSD